jgi:hypothetical protein
MQIAWTTARRVAAVVAALLVLLGAASVFSAWKAWCDFRAWESAVPADLAVDLSRPGVMEFPFKHTCTAAHGTELWLELPPASDARALLASAEARLEFLKPDRSPTAYAPVMFSGEPMIEDTRPGQALLFRFNHLARGEHLARLTITTPAPALAGLPQRLLGDYMLCGLEAAPAFVMGALAAGLWLVALLVLWLTFHFSQPGGAQAATGPTGA